MVYRKKRNKNNNVIFIKCRYSILGISENSSHCGINHNHQRLWEDKLGQGTSPRVAGFRVSIQHAGVLCRSLTGTPLWSP